MEVKVEFNSLTHILKGDDFLSQIEIVEVTLPNGIEGNSGHIILDNTQTFSSNHVPIVTMPYTFSFYAKADSEKTVKLVSGYMENEEITDTIGTDWKKVKLTYTSDGNAVVFELPAGEYWLYQGKHEEGNVATSWTPSQADADNDLLRLQLKIEATAEGLTTKVSKNQIISEINQSAEEVKIKASKIKLEGLVTANDNVIFNEDGSIIINGGSINFETDTEKYDKITLKFLEKYDGTQTTTSLSPGGVYAERLMGASAYRGGLRDLAQINPGHILAGREIDGKTTYWANVDGYGITFFKDTETDAGPISETTARIDIAGVTGKTVKTFKGADLDTINDSIKNCLLKSTFNVDWASRETDCNNLSKGIFSIYNAKNAPVANQWVTIISIPANGNASYNLQIAMSLNSNALRLRFCNAGTWSSWRTL